MTTFDILLPFVIGLFIPLLTAWIEESKLPNQLETFLNLALSALAAILPTLTFDGSWQDYGVALLVTWLGAMRGHYTGLPTKLWSRDLPGRHSALDEREPID